MKIVVTQNFNKTQPFGLAFVKLHSPPPDNSASSSTSSIAETKDGEKKFGAFFMKGEGSASPSPIMVCFFFGGGEEGN